MEKQNLSLDEIIRMARKAKKWDCHNITVDEEGKSEMICSCEINGTDIWVSESREFIPKDIAPFCVSDGIVPFLPTTYKIGAKRGSDTSEYEPSIFRIPSRYKIAKLYKNLDKNKSAAPAAGI